MTSIRDACNIPDRREVIAYGKEESSQEKNNEEKRQEKSQEKSQEVNRSSAAVDLPAVRHHEMKFGCQQVRSNLWFDKIGKSRYEMPQAALLVNMEGPNATAGSSIFCNRIKFSILK